MNEGVGDFEYVGHMRAEHHRLEQLIHRTLAVLPNWEVRDSQEWLPRMTEGLVAIQMELSHHFRDEEQEGCLEEAVARCPQLSAEVQRIARHHDDLLQGLSELVDRCQSRGKLSPKQAGALAQELRQIIRELRLHEALEDKIMQQGFSGSVQA